MRYLFTIIIFLSATIDSCMAQELAHVTAEKTSISQAAVSAAGPCDHLPSGSDHDSSQQNGHTACHECHVGHCGYISDDFKWSIAISEYSNSPYQFFVPSPFLRTMRRPPKINA